MSRPVLNGGDEETGLFRPRLVATQLECGILGQAETRNKAIGAMKIEYKQKRHESASTSGVAFEGWQKKERGRS